MLKNETKGNPVISGGHLLPPADNTYDLGSVAKSWRNIYVDSLIYVTSTVMQGDFLPSAVDSYDIGSSSYPWMEGYFGDSNDYVKITAVSNIPTIYGTGAYLRIGDAAVTDHSLNSEDDLLVTGELEVDGDAMFDGTTITFGVSSNVAIKSGITMADTKVIKTPSGGTGDYFLLQAYDEDLTGLVEVARVFSANDPYLSMGGSQQFKFYNSGVADFGAIQSDIYTVAWTDYGATSTVVGWSGTPTKYIYYKKIGNFVFVNFYISGTSDDTMATFTLPYTNVNDTSAGVHTAIKFKDNNTQSTVSGQMYLAPNSATPALYTDWAAAVWTPANAKEVMGQFWYEAQ